MKRLIMLLALCMPIIAHGQPGATLKDMMERISDSFNVDFVYDAGMDLEIPCDIASFEGLNLRQSLSFVFSGKGIDWNIRKRYVVLTKKTEKALPLPGFPEMERQDTIREARITEDIKREDVATQTSMKRLDGSSIGKGYAFFGSPDLVKTLQRQAGVASGTELMSGLYVRGGEGSDNLFLLDVVPMYQTSHLIGLFSSFNSDIIDNVDFYKGGFPARYGGRLSSVVDISTRDGDMEEHHGSFSIGSIDGRIQFEGPLVKGKTSFNLSLRRTWLDTFTTPLIAYLNHESRKDPELDELIKAGYNFNDFNAKLTHRFSDRSKLSAVFYRGRDRGRFCQSYTKSAELYDFGLVWGNTVASLDWSYMFNGNLSLRLTPYYTMSVSEISAVFADDWQTGYGTDRRGYDIREEIDTDIRDLGINASFVWEPSSRHKVRFGITGQHHRYFPSRSFAEKYHDGDETGRNQGKDEEKMGGAETAVFAEDEMTLSNEWKFNIGVRESIFFTDGKVYGRMEPRAAVKYQASDCISLRLSYAEMNQFAHLVSPLYADLPTALWMPSAKDIAPMHSGQVTAGIYCTPGRNWRLTFESYYKSMSHLYEYNGDFSILPDINRWQDSFTEGKGRTFGGELEAEYRAGDFQMDAAYTLSWNQRFFSEFSPFWYRDRNDNRHKISISASYRFNRKFELYGGWEFHSGNRITIPAARMTDDSYYYRISDNLYSSPNNLKLPDYHRLDLGFNFHRTTRRGNEATWNISIYNAYCHMNAIMADIHYDNEQEKYVGISYGIIPVIPSVSYSLKF